LVIEVAVATVGLDREKADIYAQAGVPEYWVVIPEQREVEIYRAPTAEGYGSCDRVSDTETHLRPNRVPEATIRLADLVG
jgi:Uma2 family endonuclease